MLYLSMVNMRLGLVPGNPSVAYGLATWEPHRPGEGGDDDLRASREGKVPICLVRYHLDPLESEAAL